MATATNKKRPWHWLLPFAAALASCSTYQVDFKDGDTAYSMKLNAAPFSAITGQDAQMLYRWTDAEGQIGVGSSVKSMDNTPQVEALRIVTEAAVKAAIAGAAGGAGIPPVAIP